MIRSRNKPLWGFTIVELMIVMVVFGIVVTGALGFMAAQTKAFYRGADKLTALQNLRFSMDRLETDVQTAGTNLVPGQPWLIYLDSDVLAFNADYATNIANDIGAVYYDPGAPTGSVSALTASVSIPGTSFTWGDTLYADASGLNSPGETLLFFFASDTSTTRTDDYALFRRVNRGAPVLVARNILQQNGEPFFRYFWNQKDPGSPLQFDSVADTALPWAHIEKDHGSAADTAISASMDQIRAVRVTLRATNGLSGTNERFADLSRIIVMRNAGLEKLKTCGDTPILGNTAFAATLVGPDTLDGTYDIELTWGQATDESIGEKDVIAYTIWRMAAADTTFGDPYLSISAGQPSYIYTDQSVASGDTYEYRLAAKDCTPSISGQATSAPISIP